MRNFLHFAGWLFLICFAAVPFLLAQEQSPVEGMVFIEPPIANAQGSANLTYPLALPPGRGGMEPTVQISYNSEAEGGWLGLGWGLDLPSIGIDTRWGVPTYDAGSETESYLYDGQALFPLAHRGEARARSPEAIFHPRVDSQYERIIRHGNSPATYWWEISDKTGVRHYYGGSPSTGALGGATLTTPDGNIAHWALIERIDSYGNTIRYEYDKVNHRGNAGGEMGQTLYPKRLRYTGYQNTEGPFEVHFLKDIDLGESPFQSASIDCRLGFKEVKAALLRRIEISFLGRIVRSYELAYTKGAFDKTLLSALITYNQEGEEFYRHEFTYYDDVRSNGQYRPYAAEVPWDIPDDNILGSILNPIPGMDGETSAIGGAASENFSAGAAATVGYNDFLLFSKDKTAGGTYAYGNSADQGLIALVDINADGLPDKVYKKGGSLKYRPNLGAQGLRQFGEERPIHGLRDFSTANTTSNAYGAEGNPPFAYVGFEYTRAVSTNNTYFSDFNADGLLDIAQNGQVWFNHLDANGDPSFTNNSADTPSPILSSGSFDDDLFVIDPAELEAAIDQHPLHDVVRMWEAPFDGLIDVEAAVRLLLPSDPLAQSYTADDGVSLAIQLNDTELWRGNIEADDFAPLLPDGLSGLNVSAGDRLYFRLQSVFDGFNDQVSWSPSIVYRAFSSDIDTAQQDANGLHLARYQAAEDFLLSANQEVNLPLNGNIQIIGPLRKEATTDDLVLSIRFRQGTDSIVLFSDTLLAASLLDTVFSIDLAVSNQDALSFQLYSSTQIDWQAIDWQPSIVYTSSPEAAVVDAEGEAIFRFCPTIHRSLYNTTWAFRPPSVLADSTTYLLRPALVFSDPTLLNASLVTLSVKGDGWCEKTTFSANTLASDSIWLRTDSSQHLFIEYHFADWEMANLVDSAAYELLTFTDSVPTDRSLQLASYFSANQEETVIFGPLYRGWGQFIYNGNRARAALPINQADLVFVVPEVDPEEDIPDDPDALGPVFDPVTALFLVMPPDIKTATYLGYDNFCYIGATVQSSSRLGEDNLLPPSVVSSGEGLSAPNRSTITNEYSVAGGLGFSVATGTASRTWVDTEVRTDVLDFNGDNYPDIINNQRIQYTQPQGGYRAGSVQHNIPGHHAAKSEATGFTLGGSFVPSRTSNSGEPKGGGSNRKSSKAKRRSSKLGKSAKSGGNTAGNAVGINGTFSDDGDYAVHSWIDINGDGLVDKVTSDGRAALNYGYRFGPLEDWGFPAIQSGKSIDFGGGLGVSLYNGSIAGGISLTRTDNETEQTLEDVNGDNLPDIVRVGETSTVQLNNGAGFDSSIPWPDLQQIDAGSATGESLNAAFTVCIPIPILFIKICINPSTSIGRGVGRQTHQIEDINADGFPDLIRSNNDGQLLVKEATIGRTNKLRSVQRPLGVEISLDYAPSRTSYAQPYNIWVMSEININNGQSGSEAFLARSTYGYTDGFHHRHERAFLGFGQIRETIWNTNSQPLKHYIRTFANSHFYEQGLLLEESWRDTSQQLIKSSRYTYEMQDAATQQVFLDAQLAASNLRVFPALVQRLDRWADQDGNIGLTNTTTYQYDAYGSLREVVELGAGHPDERRSTLYTYHYRPEDYILNLRDTIQVSDEYGPVRFRTSVLSPEANVIEVTHRINDNETATFNYDYDRYGNTTSLLHPPNSQGQRIAYSYAFDSLTHTYAVQETDVWGQSIKRAFAPEYGELIYEEDIYGSALRLELDQYGRPVSKLQTVEEELGFPYSQRYTYDQHSGLARLRIDRFDPAYEADFVRYQFADGLARSLQNQEMTFATDNANEAPRLQWRVSGRQQRDDFDRMVAEYYPTITNNGGSYQPAPDAVNPTRIRYDLLDRPTRYITPAGEIYHFTYSFSRTATGILCHQTRISASDGQTRILLHNTKDQLLAEAVETDGGRLLWTSYAYDAAGQLVRVEDTEGLATHYAYDGLGRLVEINHPDGGAYRYQYDAAGNLLTKKTPAIEERGIPEAQIEYRYDYDRLLSINYPFNPQNKVRYYWGDTSAQNFRANRVYLIEDGSGAQEVWYNRLGKVTKVVRTMIVNDIAQPTFVSEYAYDSWGRLISIIYPDGELVEYTFDQGGQIISLLGEKGGRNYAYILDCHYDKFGDRQNIIYGNAVSSLTTKHPATQSVTSQLTKSATNMPIAQLDYSYDPSGRRIEQSAVLSNDPSTLRRLSFQYDKAARLQSAVGEKADSSAFFRLSLDYLDDNNPSYLDIAQGNQDSSALRQDYSYAGELPHFPSQVGAWELVPTPDGHRQQKQQATDSQLSQYDEEGRLVAYASNGYISRYAYAADGQRAIKSHGPGSGLSLDATPLGTINHGEQTYSLYVSPFLEITNDSFLKYYYLDDQIIATKQGQGYFVSQLLPPSQQITAGNLDLSDRLRQIRALLLNFTEEQGVPPGHPSLPFYYLQQSATQGVLLPQLPDSNDPRFTPPPGWPAPQGPPSPDGPPGHPVWYAAPLSPDNVGAGYGYVNPLNTPDTDQYFYHYDASGSPVLVTNPVARLQQAYTYQPYGDRWLTEKPENSIPYQAFQGLTYDSESALYFSGSNYYDPTDLLWLNPSFEEVDIQVQSPYVYRSARPLGQANDMDLLASWAIFHHGLLAEEGLTNASTLINAGGDFSTRIQEVSGGAQAAAVEVQAGETKPKAKPKKGLSSTESNSAPKATTVDGGSPSGGLVGNKDNLALRRQFRSTEEAGQASENAKKELKRNQQTRQSATKQRNRKFTIRPGDWDGINTPGDRRARVLFRSKPPRSAKF